MKSFIRSLAFALAAFLAVGAPSPAQAENSDYLSAITLADDEWMILTSEGTRGGNHSQLSLQPGSVGLGGTRDQWVQCESGDDPKCFTPEALKSITASPIIPECSDSKTQICLVSLKVGEVGKELVAAKYTGAADNYRTFDPVESKNLLEGGSVSVYESDWKHTGGSQYGVMIRPTQFWDAKKKKFNIFSLQAYVMPFIAGSSTSDTCLFRGTTCQVLKDFPENTRLEVSFRVPNELGGWFSGRMRAPEIKVEKFSSTVNTITISSEPVKVAALGLKKKFSDFSATEKMWQQNHGSWSVNGGKATGANSWQPDVFPFIDYYRKETNDTSIGSNNVWAMATIGSGGGSRCLEDKTKVLGIVTTNALGYSGESPEFKKGFLDYKVAGLHYEVGGKDLVLGSYDLVMRSETARCLYGFSNAPLSATVSVTGGTGAKNVATTVVSEKNGWLKMAAYGFTFSNKTIKVKISKKAVKPSPKKR